MNRPSMTSNARRRLDLPVDPAGRHAAPAWRAAALVVLSALVALLLVGSLAGGASAQSALAVEPGEVLVAVQDRGEVVAIADDGTVRTLVGGLSQPRDVQVLQDGSILIAEAGANRVAGVGGRYGEAPTTVADYPFPSGLHQALDGTLYVTSFSEGKVSTINLADGSVTDLATGLQTPGGLIVRNGTAYVAELNGQRLVTVDRTGRVTPIADGFQAPLGVSGGPGALLFVADFGAGQIVQVESGERAVVAELPGPRGITSDPTVPRPDEAFRLVVATETNVVEVDPATGQTTELAPVAGGVGVTVVRGTPSADTGGTTPGTAAPGEAAPGEGSTPGGAATDGDGEPTGSPAAVVVLAVVILLAIGGFLYVQLRRAHAPDDDDDGTVERLDDATLHEAFGPCVTQELEAERAQAALDAVLLQVEALRRRVEEGEREAEAARHRLEEARSVREQALADRQAAVAAGELADEGPHPIHEAELHLTTDAGREALASYRAGELGPVELAKRWGELGEDEAIARVRDAGERARQVDPTVPGPDERQAQADLVEAEADVDHSRIDLTRLAARERECRAELATALDALTACRDANAGSHAGEGGHDPDQAAAWGSAAPAAPDGATGETAEATAPTPDDLPDGAPTEQATAEAVRPDLPPPPTAATPAAAPPSAADEGDDDPGFLVAPPADEDGGLPSWRPPTD